MCVGGVCVCVGVCVWCLGRVALSVCLSLGDCVCGGSLCLCRCVCVVFGEGCTLCVFIVRCLCVGGGLCLCRCVCVSVWSSGRVALSVCFCAGVCVRGGGSLCLCRCECVVFGVP